MSTETLTPALSSAESSMARGSGPFLSIIIATLGRTQELRECLESLAAQSMTDFEVLLVDQNPPGFLDRILTDFAKRLPLKYLHVDFHNACRARNTGADHSRAEWLTFSDDDCRFLPDTLVNAQSILRGDRYDFVSGRCVDEAGKASVIPWQTNPGEITKTNLLRTFSELTFFIPRRIFLKIGGFDPLFGPGSQFPAAEGIDLVLRMLGSSSKKPSVAKPRMYFDPAICFYHPEKIPPYNAWAEARFESYSRGFGAFAARHAKRMFIPAILWPLIKSAVGVLVFRGGRRRCKLAWFRGYASGFRAYRRTLVH